MDARATFSLASDGYAAGRPSYPPELFAWIASSCREHRTAWDCATGNGQAAAGLTPYFDVIEATDISPEQIEHGSRADKIRYSAQAAERTDFADGTFDLVAVAQALHWFDHDAFWPEVRRVAKPGAFFCAWGYSWFAGDAGGYATFVDPILAMLAPYWAANNRLLWDGYRTEDIRFPFERVPAPAFTIDLRWPIDQLVAYIHTWSAYKRACLDPRVADAIATLEADARLRFASRGAMALSMPITVVAGPIS